MKSFPEFPSSLVFRTALIVALLALAELFIWAVPVILASFAIEHFKTVLNVPGGEPIEIPGKDSVEFFGKNKIDVSFMVSPSKVLGTNLFVLPDDCLVRMSVDKVPLRDSRIPFCDYVTGNTFDLSENFKAGHPVLVELTVENTGGLGGLHVALKPGKAFRISQILISLLLSTSALIAVFRPSMVKR
jgi:hypothetical protein